MQFTPFAMRAQAELFSWYPGSALWGMFNGAALGEEPHCRTTQNTEHLEVCVRALGLSRVQWLLDKNNGSFRSSRKRKCCDR